MVTKSKIVVIDAGLTMTRASRLCNGKIKKVWFGSGIGDDDRDLSPCPGELYTGKVLRTDKVLKVDFLDIGPAGQVLMRHGNDHALHEGQLCDVEITQTQRGRKLPMAKFVSAQPANKVIGAHAERKSALLTAWELLKQEDDDHVLVSTGIVKAKLGEFIEDPNIDILDFVFHPQMVLPSGGVITIDEAEALTAIDIDSAAMGAPSRNRLNEKLNREAAVAIVEQLELRRIGGQIVVDFLPMPKPVFIKFDSWLKKLCRDLPGFGRAGWTPSGLFSFTLPRSMPSMLDQYTVRTIENIVQGRKLNPDFLLRWKLCAVEAKLRSFPSLSVSMRIGEVLYKHWTNNLHWEDRLSAIYGNRLRIELDANLEPEMSIIDEES